MAVDSTTSGALVSGQTGYIKAQGTITNRGTIELPNGNTAHSYGEGYVGPNSVIHGTNLDDTAEYLECETAMEDYLGESWEVDPNEYTIITNANNIANEISTNGNYTETVKNGINVYGSEVSNIYVTSNYIYTPSSGTPTNYQKAIDLGIPANTVYGVEFTFRPYNTESTTYTWCSYLSGLLDNFTIGKHENTPTEIYVRHRGVELFNDGTVSTTSYNTIKILNNQVLINGTQKTTVDSTMPISTSSDHLILFNNSAFSRGSNMYFTRLKLYGQDQSTLLADFIPAISSVGDVGVWDDVGKKFHFNLGSEAINYGYRKNEERVELEYALKEGTRMIYLTGDTSDNSGYSSFIPNFNGFEFTFIPTQDFSVASGDIVDKYLLQFTNGAQTLSNYGTNLLSICSAEGYQNGVINTDTSSTEPTSFIDAKMTQGVLNTISVKNGILTLPDGSTSSVAFNMSSHTIRVGGRYEGAKKTSYSGKYADLKFCNLKLYADNTLVAEIVPIKRAIDDTVQLYNKTISKTETDYAIDVLKAGPIKHDE